MRRAQERYVSFLESVKRCDTITTPCLEVFTFYLPRPKSVRREFPSVKPDVTNLTKFLEDCISKAGIWKDDDLVVTQFNTKLYGENGKTGVQISIFDIKVFL